MNVFQSSKKLLLGKPNVSKHNCENNCASLELKKICTLKKLNFILLLQQLFRQNLDVRNYLFKNLILIANDLCKAENCLNNRRIKSSKTLPR